MSIMLFRWLLAIGGVLAFTFLVSSTAFAQTPTDPGMKVPYMVDSGVYEGLDETSQLAFQTTVRYTGTLWLQLHFSDYNLDQQSYILITSLEDNDQQRLDAEALPQWGNATAFFNGEAVTVELHVAPGDQNVFFRIEEITVQAPVDPVAETINRTLNFFSNQPLFREIIETTCGIDNRISATDPRVGRLYFGGCTAWLTSNGSLLTAGHCVDLDPDMGESLLPDGSLDLIGVVEFNVPASHPHGAVRRAAVNDQYPIDLSSVVWEWAGSSLTVDSRGADWAIFRVHPNSNTGLTAFQVQGEFFRLTQQVPGFSENIRITGFGGDWDPSGTTGVENESHFTNQTDTGPYMEEITTAAGIQYRYRVDTEGGNSGSPLIWSDNIFAFGIHTNGGCTVDGGANSGTSFRHLPLTNALQNVHGANTIYVDHMRHPGNLEDGTVFQPYNTVAEAVKAARTNATISIVGGEYREGLTIDRPVTLIAPVGMVTIEAAEAQSSQVVSPEIIANDIVACRSARGSFPLVVSAVDDSPWCLIYPEGEWSGTEFDRFVLNGQAWTWVREGCHYRLNDDSGDEELKVDYSPKVVRSIIGTVDYVIISCN